MELEQATALLKSILVTQGKAVSPKKLACLCKWAQDKGHLTDPALVFSVPEWRAIGHTLWDTIMDGDKSAKSFRTLWREVVTALEKYRAERQLAAAAQAFLGQTAPEASGGTRLFTTGGSAAGLEVPTKPSAADLHHTDGQPAPSTSSSQSGNPVELHRAGKQPPPPPSSSHSGGPAEQRRAGELPPPPPSSSQGGEAAAGSSCVPSAPPPPPSYREAANDLFDSGDEGSRGDHSSDAGSSDGDCEMPEQKSSPCMGCRKPSDQWVRTTVGLTNADLAPLHALLRGTDPATPLTLTQQQQSVLGQLSQTVTERWAKRRLLDEPLRLVVLLQSEHVCAVLLQWQNKKKGGEGHISLLEWVFLSSQPRKSILTRLEQIGDIIRKGRTRVVAVAGAEPDFIHLPMQKIDLEWTLRHSLPLQLALLDYPGSLSTTLPKSKELHFLSSQRWEPVCHQSERPLQNARTVFTDAGKRTRKAAVVWASGEAGKWNNHILTAAADDSLQTLELAAVCWAMSVWMHEPLNVVTDSLYVAGVVKRIEDAVLRKSSNERLTRLFQQLQQAIRQRTAPFCVIHVRSHQLDEGLGEGNKEADRLVSLAGVPAPVSQFEMARMSHSQFHQNAKGLTRQFNVSLGEAQGIVRACPECGNHGPGLGVGVNPRGMKALEVWQMDVTHVAEFGRLKYVHVTVDSFSKFVWATAQAGEKTLHVKRHLTQCIAVMGVPESIKTDNGPAYVSAGMRKFMQQWNIKHVRGIPNSPTGQAIIERTNRTLKEYLSKFKDISDVAERLSRVLFVLNYLCVFGSEEVPPAVLHNNALQSRQVVTAEMWVQYRDPKDGLWKGPVKVQFSGRGYMCLSTPAGPLWVPSKWTKAALRPQASNNGRVNDS